jgi:hypothetical protein
LFTTLVGEQVYVTSFWSHPWSPFPFELGSFPTKKDGGFSQCGNGIITSLIVSKDISGGHELEGIEEKRDSEVGEEDLDWGVATIFELKDSF